MTWWHSFRLLKSIFLWGAFFRRVGQCLQDCLEAHGVPSSSRGWQGLISFMGACIFQKRTELQVCRRMGHCRAHQVWSRCGTILLCNTTLETLVHTWAILMRFSFKYTGRSALTLLGHSGKSCSKVPLEIQPF